MSRTGHFQMSGSIRSLAIVILCDGAGRIGARQFGFDVYFRIPLR